MSRVATNYSTPGYNSAVEQSTIFFLGRSSSTTSSKHSIINTGNSGGHSVTVRSAAPPPIQKETVHTCPVCNGEYKDPRILPCTHTYCLSCIRDKLFINNTVTCPKCHSQVHPFEETDLDDLPRNIILSQEWNMSARSAPSLPTPKKPVTYQSIFSTSPQMSNQRDKHKTSVAESNGHDTPRSGTKLYGKSSLADAFSTSSRGSGQRKSRLSRSPSGSSIQSTVSNLIKIYAEASNTNQQRKSRSASVASTGKYDELTRIFEQATARPQGQETSLTPLIKPPFQAREETYEGMTWDSPLQETIPQAPAFPTQWQVASENHHYPPEAPERPISTASSNQHLQIDNLRDIVAFVNKDSREQNFQSLPREPIVNSQSSSRPSTAHSQNYLIPDGNAHQSLEPLIYATIPPRQPSRLDSHTESVRSSSSGSTPRGSSAISKRQQQRDSKIPYRFPSAASSSRQSSSRFPPPPPPETAEITNFDNDTTSIGRPPSVTSIRSSAHNGANEPLLSNQTNLLSSERFESKVYIPSLRETTKSSSVHSQITNRSLTPTNRSPLRSIERDTHYLDPVTVSSTNTAVASRVDFLLSDKKRLEHEIEEQMKRLKYDYDDIRKQIDRKETSMHNELKNLASKLDRDTAEHYHRKQKIYADLAANTNTLGHELERLKYSTNRTDNKQLWDNLEQIELDMRNIRRAVEQEKETHHALAFAEGHRAIEADTIGKITYNQMEFHRRLNSSSSLPPPQPPMSSFSAAQISTNIMPYKYVKIDHLSPLEPESIAITESNKKVLLGICNKLYILDEYDEAIRTILLLPSIRGIAVSKKRQSKNIAYISHDETVSMIDIDSGQILDCVKETDSSGESSTFLPLGIDTDNIRGDVYVCDYRNSCVIKFDDKLEFITQWRVYNHSDQYDEARPKLVSVYGQKLYMIVEHSCKPYHSQGIAYSFSLHICDTSSGNIIKIIDADLLSTQRLRWPCSLQAISNDKCYILDTMTSGKYFNGQWQKHWSRVLEIGQDDNNVVTELFQLDSEAVTMAMTQQLMVIAANGDILFVDLSFLFKNQRQHWNIYEHNYQNLP